VRHVSTNKKASEHLQSESTIPENIVENAASASADNCDEVDASGDAEYSNKKRPIGHKMAKASGLRAEKERRDASAHALLD
jgi:hypothetical protein